MPSDSEQRERRESVLLKSIRAIGTAVDRIRVEDKCRIFLLNPPRFGKTFSVEVLRALRKKRLFAQMEDFAERSVQDGGKDPWLSVYYGQALVDTGRIGAAIRVLEPLAAGKGEAQTDGRGVLGRTYKDLYAGNPRLSPADRNEALKKAIGYYASVKNPYGQINLCALLARAGTDKIPLRGYAAPETIAARLLASIQNKNKKDREEWDNAIAAEACIALGKPEEAIAWVRQYIKRRDVDAFELASTLRQFEGVWRLGQGPILDLLRSALLDREGGGFDIPSREIPEARDGVDSQFREGLAAARAVGLVTAGQRVGTGFLIDGSAFTVDGTEGPVFLTDSRLIAGADLAKVRVRFGTPDSPEYKGAKLIRKWDESGISALGLRNLPPTHPVCQLNDQDLSGDKPVPCCVVGHPEAGDHDLSFSNKTVVAAGKTNVYYTSTSARPTAAGSPVFDKSWKVVAMHRGAGIGHLSDGTPFKGGEGASVAPISARTAIHEQGTPQ